MKKLAPFAAALLLAFLPLLLKEAALPALFLFFVVIPGYCLLRLLKAEMEPLPFAVSCAILSYLIATYAVYLVSLAIGYSRLSIALAFAITALPLLFLNSKFKFDVRKLRQEAPAVAASIAVFTIILILASLSIWRETGAGIINGGWNWSDFGLHLSIIQSLNSGNFPPQAPFFSGAPLNYHWFADLRTAVASDLSGIFPAYLARYETAAYAMLAFAACYIFAERLTHRRNAALLCAALVLFGGGLGWLKLVELSNTQPLPQLIAGHSFDNSWEQGWGPYRIPSVLGTTIMTWRASAAGFPAFLLALYFLVRAFEGKKIVKSDILLAGIATGLVAPFNFFTLIACMVSFAMFVLHDFAGRRDVRRIYSSAVFLVPLILVIPFIFPMLSSGEGALKLNLGWEAPKDVAGFVWFYVANFGIPLILAILGLAFVKLERKWLLAGLALAIFLVPNTISLTHVEWDMCKMFAFMWVPLCLLAAVVVERLPKWGWGPVVAVCAISPLLVSLWMVSMGWVAYSWDQVSAAYWMEANTPQDSIFVTPAFINQPTDIAGRLRLLTFPPYAANTGLDTSEREADLRAIYCGSEEESAALMEKYHTSYIVSGYSEPGCSFAYSHSQRFMLAYEKDTVLIYEFVRSNR